MIAGAAEVPVEGGALLPAVGLAHRAVHVEDDPGEPAVPVCVVGVTGGKLR
jgi:hypothetical protein